MGAELIGISLDSGINNSLYNLSKNKTRISEHFIDIRDYNLLSEIIEVEKPEIVFHLAAQPLVLESYENPLSTFETNTMGTANILECIKNNKNLKYGVIITTDKVYENKEWVWSYREDDKIGGYDPYSASKGACEVIISSYIRSFFLNSDKKVASVRAENVIGGGDWAVDRVVPDFFRSIQDVSPIILRNPNSTRPWQHVLDPLGGYLLLCAKMVRGEVEKFPNTWNFGPNYGGFKSVF